MKYQTISYPLAPQSPVHKGLLKPSIQPNSQIKDGKNYNSYLIHVENHSGTHVDAPAHFLPEGKKIGDYPPEELIFTHPLILDCPKENNELITGDDLRRVNLEGLDCIFFRTGFGKYREQDTERYLTQNPGVSPELVTFIRENFPAIRCLGTDTISISCYQKENLGIEAHLNAFSEGLSEPLLLVEDLNLGVIKDLEQVEEVLVIPWQIVGVDSAPCTVLARL
ncbi:cyclase family protein [Methanobacterium sp. CWC-01]|jgi:kynurenine formamidase|uniref:cyclase family protein n=1 Tax=Methanobacterium aridiramus TaxID=2584467 RepID=UPI00257812DD|nr:cyclase family protein [Methanobacterium sp. CWC-01]WJI10209.1 cyclase family protein [Methanobacterium sp. CWC-01]